MAPSVAVASQLKGILSNTPLNKAYIAESRIKKSLRQAAVYAKGVALDVGCGTKPYKELIDSQERVVRYFSLEYPGAKDYFSEQIKEFDIFGDAQHLPLKSKTIDTVLCAEVIEHVPEPFQLLQEVWRVLKKDGTLILTAPSTWKIHCEPHDYFRFTHYGLKYLLNKSRFKLVSLQCRGRHLATIGQSLSVYLNETFVNDPTTQQPRLFWAALILPFCAVIQVCFLVLDRFTKSETLTLGYTVIAQKSDSPDIYITREL
jgi:SAM-dependent methyltransferase